MKIKTALITGPTGAVGIALINELLKHDATVYAVCHKGSKRIDNIPKNDRVKIIFCNLDELSLLPNLINEEIDVFYHFAWDGTYGNSRNDVSLQMKNIEYSIDAVTAANMLKCKVFVGAGSQSEYGHSDEIKTPTSFCNPDNFYGAAKLSAMQMTKVYANQLGIKHVWCRIFSLFGPNDGAYTMIMSSVNKLLNNEPCNFTKGEQVWDYIYSKDAAKAFRLVAETGKDGSIYCFASGKTRLLKDFITSMHDIVNPNCEINLGAIPYYEHQAMNLTADITNLKNDTGFEPDYTFEEGIKDLINTLK